MATSQVDKNTFLTKNGYTKGFSLDIDKLKISQEVYINAENIRLQSVDGDLLAITNSKGERFEFSVPNTNRIYKLKIDFTIFSSTPTTVTAVVNGTSVSLSVTNKSTYEDITNQLSIGLGSQIALGNLTVQCCADYILIVGLNVNFNIPTFTPSTGFTITTHIHVQNNLKIIGIINIKDTLFLFTTNNRNSSPNSNAVGQIWKVKYNENTNTVQGLISNQLVPSVHLIYNEKLNFTTYHRISGEGRYESSNKQSVYFTDNFNNLRCFNVVKQNSFATPPGIIQVNPLNFKSIPTINNINEGGFIPNGKIQYFYQLVTEDGIETFFSNPSEMIDITNSPLNSSFQLYQGGDIDLNSGKSIDLTISNIDLTYSIIRVGYIHYSSLNLPTIALFYEGSIPLNGELQLTHSYNESLNIPLTSSLYSLVANPFDICKGIETKKNILFPYNLTEKNFDVDFDARAYRFNTAQEAELYQENQDVPKVLIDGSDPTNNTTINYTTTGQSWIDIPETDDVINPYNFEDPNLNIYGRTSGQDWFTESQYKFQTDGSTLGGEGPNIKYKFINSAQQFGDIFQSLAVVSYPFVQDYPQNGANQFSSMKNPLNSMRFYSHSRGEVYRYGIVFYDLSNRPSFVKWIGDIKFPNYLEENNADPAEFELFSNYDKANSTSYPDGEYVFTQQIGIEFTLDTTTAAFQAIKNNISGWSYVRVERTSKDKTRLGTGLVNALTTDADSKFINASRVNQWLDYGSTNPSNCPGYLVTFENMSFKFDVDYNYGSSDYLKLINFSKTGVNGITTLAGNFMSDGWYEKQYINIASIYANNDARIQINKLWDCPVSVNKSAIAAQAPYLSNDFVNASEWISTGEYAGLGGKTTLLNAIVFNSTTLNFYNNTTGFTDTEAIRVGDGKIKILASYERYLTNQYGGPSFNARTGQTYITTGQFELYDSSLTSVVTSVYSGDCYSMITDFTKIEKNWGQGGWTTPTNKLLIGQIFPAEVHANIHLRQGYHFANKQYPGPPSSVVSGGPYDDGNHLYDEYILNEAYNQQNNTKKFFSKPFNYNPILERPHRIQASQEKFDGENINAWMVYKTADYIDVEGSYGPINRVILFNDKALVYQDYGICTVDILEKQTVSGDAGTATTIGIGTVLQRYDYISKLTGSKHQFGIIKTPNGVYHYDASTRKIYILGNGLEPLTDIKGISTWSNKNLLYEIKELDLTLAVDPVGVTCGYNPRFNQIYFTFFDHNEILEEVKSYTLVFNELENLWESFCYPNLGVYPAIYFNTETRFLSVPHNFITSSQSLNRLYLHNEGNYNEYYGINQKSKFSIIVNGEQFAEIAKRFDIIEFVQEGYNSSGVYQPNESITSIKVSNDYQSTPTLTNNNLKKRFKAFRLNTLRDNISNQPRLRDMYIKIDIEYYNPNNNKLVIHDISTYFVPQPL